MGWMRDRDLRLSLARLLGDARGEVMPANAVEDAMFLLMSAVQSEGFLKPVIAVECVDASGRNAEFMLDESMATMVPRTLQAREVRFRVKPGVRFFVSNVTFAGLHALKEKAARSFFMGDSALFSGKASRAHTPSRLSRALGGLQAELRQLGYAEAEARASAVAIDERTGAVGVAVAVTEGARWQVSTVQVEGAEGTGVAADLPAPPRQAGGGRAFVGKPWSDALQQSVAGAVKKAFYEKGYADARVRVTREAGPARDGRKDVAVTARVQAGELVRLGAVRFEGAVHVREGVLRRGPVRGAQAGGTAANDQKVVPGNVQHGRLALRSGPGEGPGLEGHQNQRAQEEEDRAGGPEQPLGDGPPRPGADVVVEDAAHADQAVA